jgi:hypothetical protein
MPRKPLADRPMTNAERQARHRAARAATLPLIHYRRATDRRSRARRWRDAVAELLALQAEYAAWLEHLPEALHDSATGEALQAIVDLDLDDLVAIAPPRGYGRDGMPLDPTQRVMKNITANQQGGPPPPADINRNGRPTSIGMGGRHQSECPADIIGIRNLGPPVAAAKWRRANGPIATPFGTPMRPATPFPATARRRRPS